MVVCIHFVLLAGAPKIGLRAATTGFPKFEAPTKLQNHLTCHKLNDELRDNNRLYQEKIVKGCLERYFKRQGTKVYSDG